MSLGLGIEGRNCRAWRSGLRAPTRLEGSWSEPNPFWNICTPLSYSITRKKWGFVNLLYPELILLAKNLLTIFCLYRSLQPPEQNTENELETPKRAPDSKVSIRKLVMWFCIKPVGPILIIFAAWWSISPARCTKGSNLLNSRNSCTHKPRPNPHQYNLVSFFLCPSGHDYLFIYRFYSFIYFLIPQITLVLANFHRHTLPHTNSYCTLSCLVPSTALPPDFFFLDGLNVFFSPHIQSCFLLWYRACETTQTQSLPPPNSFILLVFLS